MKKFTKIMLILSGVFATIGLTCIITAFGMGLTSHDLWKMVRDGKFTFDQSDLHIGFDMDWNENWDAELSATESQDGEMSIYEVQEACEKVNIEFDAGILEIYYDDVDSIQVKKSNDSDLKVSMKNDTLVISEHSNIEISFGVVENSNNHLVIVVPNGMKFESVKMEIGASKADMKGILADKVNITVGAGKAELSDFVVEQFDLEVGAGEVTVNELMADKIDVSAGMGKVNIGVNGVQDDYNYDVECGIGKVVIGNHSYEGLGREQSVKNQDATKEIDVECGIGEVIIEFKDMFEEL